jgi:DNA repair protein RadC
MQEHSVMKRLRVLPLKDRPREKLKEKGPQVLSDLELLAVLIGSGSKGRDVLKLAGGLLRLLDDVGTDADMETLCRVDGIGPAKASLVMAALEFARRRIRPHGIRIAYPPDVYPLIRHLADRRQEQFVCISLNGANEVIAIRTVSVGLVNRALVHPREVFADPITDRAAAVIVAHNHPSGNLSASSDDLSITRQLKEAGHTLGIKLLDHLIFDHSAYCSMLEEGLL